MSVVTNPMVSVGENSESKSIDGTTDRGLEHLVKSGIPVKELKTDA